MQFIDVIRHHEEPRSEHFLEIPTPYGKLRFDILSQAEKALEQTGLSDEDAEVVRQRIGEAQDNLQQQAPQQVVEHLLAIIRDYPYAAPVYQLLSRFCLSNGDAAEAIFYQKQLVALQPHPEHLIRLGQLFGRTKRVDEAAIVQERLWTDRAALPKRLAHGLANDYLVTLSRLDGAAEKMLAVAEENGESKSTTMRTSILRQYLANKGYNR